MRSAIAFSLLDSLVARTIKKGSLTLVGADGDRRTHGDGAAPVVTMRLADPSLYGKILLNPELSVGEAYMDGSLTFEAGELRDFLNLFHLNAPNLRAAPVRAALARAVRKLRRFQQFNPIGKAQENVAHHYDISNAFYRLFLDADLQYSCAYFEHDGQSLDEAQQAKLRHIAAKLRIEPGMRVLDIGCGWGGMALFLAERLSAKVVGVTLSREQFDLATARAAERGLSGKVEFRLTDYRDVSETFDRIVSVGMFEHVGVPHYPEFFWKLRDLLADDGLALIHTIGRKGPPGVTGPWIRKYIFPGGYSPALSEMSAAIEPTGLWISDVEVLRLHYADTLREWSRRFAANRDQARAMFDERFCRMWEFYLATAEFSFRSGGQVNFQVQIATSHQSAPVRRDYMAAAEAALKAARP
ncbi:MAG: cyclopropane-fatty-acyl-phospholipid synthase family protein [Parvularculaceae bacterium]|nr:cyclopropane-fatty-acyl-phospholipid synthase family protein [Parvularculaceae bacterium]